MKIVVCIKQVPDTVEVKLDPKTNTLIREGVPSIINHDDKAGLETALQIREQVGGTVSVVCMGPPQADVALREALAMGADEAYLLSAREFGGSDTYATATIIATALRKIGFDLVITGRQAIDGDTAQVGPQIAEQLHVPQVSYAEELKVEGDSVIVKRQFEDQAHMLKVKTPCLITALSELNEARYMSVGGIVDAYNKSVTVWASTTSRTTSIPSSSASRVPPRTCSSPSASSCAPPASCSITCLPTKPLTRSCRS